ncbi:MAG: hypothetical protein ACOX8R_10680 [Bacillota bacterium]|jgi:hypothetical protein
MINNYDKHVELMKNNLRDLGLSVKNVSEKTKKVIYTDEHPESTAGKMFEDDWED